MPQKFEKKKVYVNTKTWQVKSNHTFWFQNAIARSHVTYFSKEVLALTFGGSRFDFFACLFWCTFLCFDEAAFSFNVVVAGKTSVWFRWLAWLSNSTLKLSPVLQFHQRFGGEIVLITRLARSGCQVVLICHVFWRAEVQWFDYPVRWVTSFCSFHMEKPHPTEADYPDRLTG